MINRTTNLSDSVIQEALEIVTTTYRLPAKRVLRTVTNDPRNLEEYRWKMLWDHGKFLKRPEQNKYLGFCMLEGDDVFDIWITPTYNLDEEAARAALIHELSHGYSTCSHGEPWRSLYNRSMFHYNTLVKDVADVPWMMRNICKRYGSNKPKWEAAHHLSIAKLEHKRVKETVCRKLS